MRHEDKPRSDILTVFETSATRMPYPWQSKRVPTRRR